MPIQLRATVQGAAALTALMKALEPKVFRKAARSGVTEAGQVVVKEMKVRVSKKRTGALHKSIGKKVKAVKGGKGYYAVVGPRRDPSAKKFARQQADFAAGRRKRPPRMKFRRVVSHNGRDVLVDPAKYAHLVEYGRKSVTVGTKSVRRKGKVTTEETGKRVLSDGQTIFGRTVAAVAPSPFARPAWQVGKAQAYAVMTNHMKRARQTAAQQKAR